VKSKILHFISAAKLFRLSILAASIFFVSLQLSATSASAAQATLSWAAPTYTDGTAVTNLGGYRVYMGTSSSNMSQLTDVGKATTDTVTSLADGTTYYFAVTDYDTSGTESGYSNQVAFTTPVPAPSLALYTITASAGTGGSITPSGATVVSKGASQACTVTPSVGYYVVSVVVDGTTVASNIPSGGYSYSFSNVAANHSVSATFAVRDLNIVATAGTGGAISPANVWVPYNSSQTVTITPASGYAVSSVQVDGSSVGAVGSYTFSGLTANHTINATFAPATASYNISASAGTGGTISPSGTVAVTKAANKSFTITPNAYYYVASVVVDGTTVASNIPSGGYTYTFGNVTAAHTISATFIVKDYNVVSTAGTGGTVSPTNAWATYNTSQTIAITPGSGKTVSNVLVDGVSVGAVSSYTFKNLAANHTLSATFK
jgi:hypothetical protein